ncbi:MAG: hypothetical protein HN804_10955, partial [Oceanospirillaceae bacterium]|nr:hypothetical protein [Oceanospirillaceae bacterium]
MISSGGGGKGKGGRVLAFQKAYPIGVSLPGDVITIETPIIAPTVEGDLGAEAGLYTDALRVDDAWLMFIFRPFSSIDIMTFKLTVTRYAIEGGWSDDVVTTFVEPKEDV